MKTMIFLFGVVPAIAWIVYGSLIIFTAWNSIVSYWVVMIVYSGAILGTIGLAISLFENKNNIYVNWIKSFLLLIGIATMLYIYVTQKAYRGPLIWEQMSMIMPIFFGLIAVVRNLGWEISLAIAVRRL